MKPRFEGEEFTCEWKYDGERAQIHVPGEDAPDLQNAAIFSRNQENNTRLFLPYTCTSARTCNWHLGELRVESEFLSFVIEFGVFEFSL